MMTNLRENRESIYNLCMNYLIKVPATRDEDFKMFAAVKVFNHGYIEKLLLQDARSAHFNCTWGLWLLLALVFIFISIVAIIVYKLILKFLLPSNFVIQSCINMSRSQD